MPLCPVRLLHESLLVLMTSLTGWRITSWLVIRGPDPTSFYTILRSTLSILGGATSTATATGAQGWGEVTSTTTAICAQG
jgi:hypothetical protein